MNSIASGASTKCFHPRGLGSFCKDRDELRRAGGKKPAVASDPFSRENRSALKETSTSEVRLYTAGHCYPEYESTALQILDSIQKGEEGG